MNLCEKSYQERISDDIAEMESLVEILLSYARLEQSMVKVEKQLVSLSGLVTDCIQAGHITGKTVLTNGVDKFMQCTWGRTLFRDTNQ